MGKKGNFISYSKREFLDIFGKELIEKARDSSIAEMLQLIKGQCQAPSSKTLYKKIQDKIPDNDEVLEDIIIDSIDHALNNFLWMIEQNDILDIVGCNDENQVVSLKDASNGLSAGYWNFVDENSQFKRL